MRVEIDAYRCVGCGLCEESLPEVFRMGRHTAQILQPDVPPDVEREVRRARGDCPAEAIIVSEDPPLSEALPVKAQRQNQ